MIIKEYLKKKKINFNYFFKLYFIISVLVIVSFFSIFFNSGIWTNNKNDFLNRIYFNGLNHYLNIFEITYKGFKGLFYNFEEIHLDLSYENLIILEKNRKEIISNSDGAFRAKNQEFSEVKGFASYKDQKVPIRLRLKGDRLSHIEEKDKSSYKVEVGGEEKIKAIRKFSFIKPRARNYIHEWLFHELAGEGELVKLKYDFVNLKINGESQGLYVFEEGFDKDLIERNRRRNGPIFSIYEEYNPNIFQSKLELYNKNFWNRAENIQLASYAENKLKGFLENKFSLSETFDLEKWAYLFALTDLTYTHHGLDPTNVKFYYNPTSGLFEPIAYDGHRFSRNYNKNLKDFNHRSAYDIAATCLDKKINDCEKPKNYIAKWLYYFFFDRDGNLNLDFYSEYIKSTKKITNENFLFTFFEKRKKDINKINSAIYSDYFLLDNISYGKYGPGLYYFTKEDLFYRAQVLKKKIQNKLNKISAIETNDSIIIESNNDPSNISLIIDELICEKFENKWRKNFTYKVGLRKNLKNRIEIKKNNPYLSNSQCTYVKFKDEYSDKIYLKKINYNLPIFFSEGKIRDKYLNYFYKKNNILFLKKKEVEISEDIIIPEKFIVKIKSGENIKITNGSFIISDSAWEIGDENGKVLISGYKDNFGGGLVIKNTKQTSKINNTEFKYLSGVENRFLFGRKFDNPTFILTKYSERKKNNYLYKEIPSNNYNHMFSSKFNYTGAINFYNTNAILKNSKFTRIDSEDALNLISSKFLIENTFFEENSSDSIDIDFGEGKIKKSSFINIGNDAVDLSGSEVYLEDLFFLNVGDKLISAGENAKTNIKKIEGKNSHVGIASKDGSISIAENINFVNVKIPFASYQKKKTFKHGILKINNPINLKNYVAKYVKDKNSYLMINNEKIKNPSNQAFNIVYKKKLNLIND